MELRLPARRGAVVMARRWALRHARELGVAETVLPVVELLTSELVANAVRHGGPADVSVRLTLAAGALTVAVTDGSDDLPVTRTTGPEVPGGHGMRLVARLAAASGVEPHRGGGKTVWFRVAATDDPG